MSTDLFLKRIWMAALLLWLMPLARAEITCLCLDEASGKMVAAPLRLREQLANWIDP